MPQGPVFYDPAGRRQRLVTSSGRVAGLVVGVASTLFLISLLGAGLSPSGGAKRRPLIPKNSRPDVPSGLVTGRIRSELVKLVDAARSRPAASRETRQAVVGFYTGDDAGLQSLKLNAKALTHLMPEWFALSPDGAQLDADELDRDPNSAVVISICRQNGVLILPVLSNFDGEQFSSRLAHELLASPANAQRLAGEIREKLRSAGLAGVNVDLENLDPSDYPAYAEFLRTLRQTFAGTSLMVTVDLEASLSARRLGSLARPCDFAVLMAYDEHDEGGPAGPIASWSWVQSTLAKACSTIPAGKLVLGIGAYSLDWRRGASGGATTDSYQEALTTAAESLPGVAPEQAIVYDGDSFNSSFEYEDDQGDARVCWMQDGVSAFNSWTIGRASSVRGYGVWALGQEDPTIWSFLNRDVGDVAGVSRRLADVHYPYEVDNVGKGELLTVQSTWSDGRRIVRQDPETGLVRSSVYQTYPSPYVIAHHGYLPKRVALTFDDGPDPNYTPRILDILKAEGVKATFFMIGERIEEFPRLVQRVYAEGHTIGSHTFFHPDLGNVSDRRINLELNATQRSIQSVVGRSTTFFRPPYNADRDPATVQEVHPIVIAASLGYTIVGESIDPQDWDPYRQDDQTGAFRPRTVDDIVRDTLAGVKQFDVRASSDRDGGNCILLHDAGGDREKTVAALPIIIRELRRRGYVFCNVDDLARESRAQAMPPIDAKDRLVIFFDKLAFGTIFTFLQLLAWAFLIAICLGIARELVVVPLALVYARRARRRMFDPAYRPSVTAVVAAYNEERVIARTVRSILLSDYPVAEVIVVDDGSTDATVAAVAAAFGADSRVRVLSQENRGKAEALNLALAAASNEVIVSVDADTQLMPGAVGLLVRHFARPEVGAVAGDVQVGNMRNTITVWQDLEYTTSQNMDRRAYALLNCITVVPGAVGAWRRSAVLQVGGHQSDTLAEDMDLTWRLRIAGWVQLTESEADGYTEAPETVRAFFRQRFRWAYGTLQCLFKHRRALGRYGWFGRLALPGLWVFQIVFQALAPLIDLQILISLFGFGLALFSDTSKESSPLGQAVANLRVAATLYAIFFGIELIAAAIAYGLEGKRLRALWWLFLQRFAYRQIMYAVVLKSLRQAVFGARQGWGKLDRTASVRVEP